MWNERSADLHWEVVQIEGRLLPEGLTRLIRSKRTSRWERSETFHIEADEVTLSLTRRDLVLHQYEEEVHRVPLGNIKKVDLRSYSVPSQIRRAFRRAFHIVAWTGAIKMAILAYVALWLAADPRIFWVELPEYLLLSIQIGLIAHFPMTIIPRVWRIEGRRWKVRFEPVGGLYFSVMLHEHAKQRLLPRLEAARVDVLVVSEEHSWLDRQWPAILAYRTKADWFLEEFFDIRLTSRVAPGPW